MRPVTFIVPGKIETRTGGYLYDLRMMEGLRRLSRPVGVRELDASFPFPTTSALEHAAGTLADLGEGSIAVIDGLAFGAMPGLAARESVRLRLVALVHLPLAADVGLDRETAARLEAGERRALAAAALVIVTGRATLPMLDRYALPPERVVVVEPGTDREPLARGSGRDSLQLLSVATLNPGKGHEVLLRALASVRHRNWTLACAGSVTRHPATVDRLRDVMKELGVEDRVTILGELDTAALARWYDSADLFVLATLQETYGMAVAEALARGLPVVSTTTGAMPDLVGDDAGVLVPPGDAEALAQALTRVIGDEAFRTRLAEGARRVRDRLPTWEHAVNNMNAALSRVDTHG